MTDPLVRQANTLVSAAQIQAVGSYTPLVDRFRLLKTANIDSWDFIVTIACVFVGTKRLADLRLDAARESALMDIVTQRLAAWAPDGVSALDDCKRMYEHEASRLIAAGHDPNFVASDALGRWIVWNVFNRQPSTEPELAMSRGIGVSAVSAFFSWWSV